MVYKKTTEEYNRFSQKLCVAMFVSKKIVIIFAVIVVLELN